MIKIKSILWLMVAAIAGGLTMVSCSSSDSTPVVIPPRDNTPVDYTIMYYSAGGENLDIDAERDLTRAAKALQTNDKQVRFIVQYKYSTQEGLNKNYPQDQKPCGVAGGLYRFELLPSQINQDGMLNIFSDNMLYGNQQEKSKIYRSDSLTSFINYCQRVAPAKNYILMFSDHGNGYVVWDDYPKTRSIVSDLFQKAPDDYVSPGISICDIRDGIRNSNMKHVRMINFDACLMNTLEVLTEVMDETDYVMASSFVSNGGDYTHYIDYLRKACGDGSLEKNMSDYLKSTIEMYNTLYEGEDNARYVPANTPKRCDWVLTDMSRFKATVPAAVTEFRDKLVKEDASNFGATGLKDAAEQCYHSEVTTALYDLGQYATLLAKYNDNIKDAADKLKAAMENAQICHHYTNKVKEDFNSMDYKKLTYTVSLGAKIYDNPLVVCLRAKDPNNSGEALCYGSDGNFYFYNINNSTWRKGDPKDYDKDAKWDSSYYTTAFDKATGWSKWLEKNTCFPTGNPPFWVK